MKIIRRINLCNRAALNGCEVNNKIHDLVQHNSDGKGNLLKGVLIWRYNLGKVTAKSCRESSAHS